MPARWSPGGICSPTCGGCPTAGPTRQWTSTSRGCAASSGRRPSNRVTSTPYAGSGSSSALRSEPAMRLRIILLVLAASSLVLISVLAALWVLLHPQPHTWLVLGCVGLGALVVSGVIAARLALSLVGPLTNVAKTADRLAAGDLSARAAQAGPAEVRRAGTGLNKLARRIGELLAYQQETMADVSHRLRTPMTALRIDAESLQDHIERT